MKATRAFEAKRALFDEIKARVGAGMFDEEVQVCYSYPRDRLRVIIYGGGIQFQHEDLAEEVNLVGHETIGVGVYIKALKPGGTVQSADDEVEAIADAIVKVFEDEPQIAGNMTWIGVRKGHADYSETPEGPESTLSIQVEVGAILI